MQCLKKPAKAKAQSVKKDIPKPGSTKKDVKLDRKNVASRAWHRKRDEVFAKTGDDEKAKHLASIASQKARQEWDRKHGKDKSH